MTSSTSKAIRNILECSYKIKDDWYPFLIKGETYHLEVRIVDSQVKVCIWDWDKEIKQIGNQITHEWRICDE